MKVELRFVLALIGAAGLLACGRQGFDLTPCQDVVCSGHGHCVVLNDSAQCICDPGYHQEGLKCVRDAAGPCEGVDCSGHGRCVLLDGAAQCICDPGYENDGPTACVAGTTVCDGIDCSGHGTCGIAADGTAVCSCLAGYHNDGPTACVPDSGSGKCATEKDCDDSNQCTTDICTAAGECQNDFNTDPCDDGLYCTYGDVCDGAGNCTSGGPRDCSALDGECRVGVCNEGARQCESQPAAEGTPCGSTYCDGLQFNRQICQGGVCSGFELLENCNDGEDCTTDGCDAAGGCSHTPVADGAECGLRYCNGLEWMSPTCQSGACSGAVQVQLCDDGNPCTDDACDPAAGCSRVNNTDACDDQDPCTMNDVCHDGSCSGAPLDGDGDTFVSDACGGADCDDGDSGVNPGVFEGPEGTSICSDGVDNDCDGLTDLADDTCKQCTGDADCDDDDVCNGMETCVASQCVAGTPLTCNDGQYCNGTETCDPVSGCQAGTPPCPETECNHCQEASDGCFDPSGTPCSDDGQYCNGTEACDGAGACVSSGNPCSPETDCNHCNETDGSCLDPAGAPCPEDGLYCNGTESCDGAGTCASSGDPCPGTECNNCYEPDDSCFDPAGTTCSDDGLYCTGAETCDGAGTCGSAGDPCPGTPCNTCQEDLDGCFDPPTTSCDDGLYCTLTDTCDGAGNCTGSGSPCQANEVCIESTDTCQLSGCTGQPDCTPCNDGLYCTADDACIEGECLGFGDPCSAGEVCNETTDACEAQCATNCSSLDDACNTGVCNPQSGLCELQPKPIGTVCSPDGGDNYMFCQDGICTHWCNHSYQLPGDPDHECPVGYYCKFYRDADSVGHCQWHPLGGTKPIGETCTYTDECRAYFDGIWSTCQDGRCSDACSSTLDCRDAGPDTSDWICQASAFQSAKFDHGTCSPPQGSGQTGDSCAGYDDCIDGRCYDNGDGSWECRNMCCTEAECAGGRICWFWEDGEAPSTIKLCMDKGTTGPDGFGTACTGASFFDSDCSTGLCVDVGEGERCNRFCCRDTDCPAGYMCDFAFIVLRQANKNSRVRACVPEVVQLPDSGPGNICMPGDKCGLTIPVTSFPAQINGDNTGFSSFFNSHGSPLISCTGYNYYGRDVIYEIVVPDGSALDVMMDPSSADLGIYLLDFCDADFSESNCLDGDDDGGGGAAESVSWTNNTGSEATVFLVVDGWNGEQVGPYTLDVDVTP